MKTSILILVGAIGLTGCTTFGDHHNGNKGSRPIVKPLTPALEQELGKIGIHNVKKGMITTEQREKYLLVSASEDDGCNPKPPCYWQEVSGEYQCANCSSEEEPWWYRWFYF